MAVAPAPSGFRRTLDPRSITPLLILAGIGGVLAVRLFSLGDTSGAQTFTVIFTAIVVEALPFVLLGAIVSAAIEVFVGDRTIERVSRLPVWMQVASAAVGGAAFPVCECGSVPVSRRLMRRGIHPAAGITFMLASPIFNPVVLASTYIAYAPRGLGWQMTGARAGAGVVVAVAIGWALGAEGVERLVRRRGDEEPAQGLHSRGQAFVDHISSDLIFMGKFLVLGAAFAAALQTAIPQSTVAGVATTPLIGTLGLMAVAYLASLCSEADAFVAVSFAQFPLGSQLAFMVFGPVLDLKLTFLYGATFTRRFVTRLAFLAVPVTLALSLVFEVATQ